MTFSPLEKRVPVAMLPADFPDWRTCYKYFRQWSERPGPGQDSIWSKS